MESSRHSEEAGTSGRKPLSQHTQSPAGSPNSGVKGSIAPSLIDRITQVVLELPPTQQPCQQKYVRGDVVLLKEKFPFYKAGDVAVGCEAIIMCSAFDAHGGDSRDMNRYRLLVRSKEGRLFTAAWYDPDDIENLIMGRTSAALKFLEVYSEIK